MRGDELTALVVALLVVSGCVLFGLRHSQSVAGGTRHRAIRLTAAFRAIAARLGLEDPWPGRRVDEEPQPGVELSYPALRGTYKNHRVNVLVHTDGASVEHYTEDNFIIIVRAPRGKRWTQAGRVDRGAPPGGLSASALQALERLRARKADKEVLSIRVDAEELTCITDDRLTNAVGLDQARAGTALPHPTELEAILDDLVTLASGLPAT
jgi:hypothetical protein